MSASKTVEERLKKVEDGLAEWNAVLRVRVSGCPKLTERCREVAKGHRQFWQLKPEVIDLLLTSLGPLLPLMFSDGLETSVLKELKETMGQVAPMVGVFNIGGEWGSEKHIDVVFRASLAPLRLHHLVTNVLNPGLRKLTPTQNPDNFQLWIPLSQPEMERKQKRRNRDTPQEGNGRRVKGARR